MPIRDGVFQLAMLIFKTRKLILTLELATCRGTGPAENLKPRAELGPRVDSGMLRKPNVFFIVIKRKSEGFIVKSMSA